MEIYMVSSSSESFKSMDLVFFPVPDKVKIDEEAKTGYATSQKIEVLIKELKDKGPHVALGKLGPGAYTAPPFKLKNKVKGLDIYGWDQGTNRIDYPRQISLMVIGARKIKDKHYVYYTLSKDITGNLSSYLREHVPADPDRKVYINSHETFSNYLFDLYPPFATQETEKPTLTNYVAKLSALPLDSILDYGDGEKACKILGQKIFDDFKKRASGKSLAGKVAVQGACERVAKTAPDGRLRKQYIERAWDGIGDENWRWMA